MEMIDSLILSQSFIWGGILLKQKKSPGAIFAFMFLATGIIFIARTVIPSDLLSTPHIIIQNWATLFLGFAFYFLSAQKSGLLISRSLLYASGLFVVSHLLRIVFSQISEGNNYYWWYLLGAGTIILIYNFYEWIKSLKKRNFTARWYHDEQLRFNLIFLLSLFLILAGGIIQILSGFNEKEPFGFSARIYLAIIAIIMFVLGYNSLTLEPFTDQVVKKEQIKPDSKNVVLVYDLMENEKPYLDSELTLGKMADMLQIDDHELTRIMNEEMGVNFYRLINDYRIKTVKEKLKMPSNRNFTIMASAYECGFNSKSTFYRIFKEYTGLTPKDYLEKQNLRQS